MVLGYCFGQASDHATDPCDTSRARQRRAIRFRFACPKRSDRSPSPSAHARAWAHDVPAHGARSPRARGARAGDSGVPFRLASTGHHPKPEGARRVSRDAGAHTDPLRLGVAASRGSPATNLGAHPAPVSRSHLIPGERRAVPTSRCRAHAVVVVVPRSRASDISPFPGLE